MSSREDTPPPVVLIPVSGTVEFAAGRGRVDVLQVSAGPAVRVDSVYIAAPLARAGDYYLFDSTGYLVVRPRERTFSSFSLSIPSSYNYQDSREGWPKWFGRGRGVPPMRVDTIGPADDSRPGQPREFPIYWHMELYRNRRPGGIIRILAAGHLALAASPVSEYSIARFFGPTQALANLPGGVAALPADSLRFTAGTVLGPSPDGPDAIDVGGQHPIIDLEATDVDVSRLVLPDGYTQVPVLGLQVSRDDTSRWRTVPVARP